MQRKFLANLILLLFLNLLVKPLYIFGIDLGVQNLVGPDEYGIFFSMFNFSMLFNILLDAGITNYNNRNISQYRHLLNKHFSGIFTLRLLLAVVYVLIAFGTGLMAGYSQRQMQLLGFLAFNQFIISFILYLRSNIAGLQLFKTDSLISVLDRVILIVLCGYLIYNRHTRSQFTVEWFAICQTAAYLVTFLVALLVVMRKAAFRRFYWNPTFARMILRNSFPYALLALLMMFYFRIDSVLLERLLPAGTGSLQAGIYASAFRLLDAFLMIPYLFSVLLLPMFARMIRFRENPGQIISIAFPIILLFSVGTVALSLG
ncbi:MAG TPA: oligosaccharide flippase family protein, partial [Bacteroidales bacterium]|nr:oligosaccharide flippase family protein [Bacteroidales bacterium]